MSHPFESFVNTASRYLFFTGKGGVGKTSLASATAIALAEKRKKVLLVSTDPASNLDEVLQQPLGSTPVPIPLVPGLFAQNIDPEIAAAAYRERVISPFRGKLPAPAIASMEEQLSGACTVEIAAFQEFTLLLGNPFVDSSFDHIVFDTAPTGHTLRLLSLPKAWSSFLETNNSGASCLGPLSGLAAQKTQFKAALSKLTDPSATTVVIVTRPQKAAFAEAERTAVELRSLGLSHQALFLNAVFDSFDSSDPAARAYSTRARLAIESYKDFLASMPVVRFPLQPGNLLGIDSLRKVAAPQETSGHLPVTETASQGLPLADLLAPIVNKKEGVILVMGKGGVGKTTIAAAIADFLSNQGLPVHLTTTDPAAHVTNALNASPNLQISRIDPAAELAKYTAEVLATSGSVLDADGLELLKEELRSPCTEEIAVFRAFAKVVDCASSQFVVIDTAPTGHTLLLLDATESYHREVTKRANSAPPEVLNLLPRLRDPNSTYIFLATLPEATPVHEAERLQADLRRAGIQPFAWIINQSLQPIQTIHPILSRRRSSENRYIMEVEQLSKNFSILPLFEIEPAGTHLQRLFENAPHAN